MKRAVLVLALVGVVVAVAFGAAAALAPRANAFVSTGDGSWLWQDPLPQGSAFRDVAAVGTTHAWAVGVNGLIFATTDGGRHWVKQHYDPTIALNAVSFVDATHGWALGEPYPATVVSRRPF